MAVILYARERGLEVHISTQLNVSNILSLKYHSQFADVVVLARELNLHQVKEIYETIEKEQIKGPSGELVKLEMFCHGALCMAVSGKCYLSNNNSQIPPRVLRNIMAVIEARSAEVVAKWTSFFGEAHYFC
jgi:putative protease